jgi:preprotein translocase subunit YajC
VSQGFLVLAQLGGGGSATSTLIFMGAIFAIMWFVLILPQQRQVKQHKAMLDTLKKGDEILIQGGLIGRIQALEDKTLTLEIANGVRVRVVKTSVQQLWSASDAAAAKSDSKSEKTEEKK